MVSERKLAVSSPALGRLYKSHDFGRKDGREAFTVRWKGVSRCYCIMQNTYVWFLIENVSKNKTKQKNIAPTTGNYKCPISTTFLRVYLHWVTCYWNMKGGLSMSFLEFTCELIYHIKKRKVASNQNPLLLSGKAVKRDLNIFPYMFWRTTPLECVTVEHERQILLKQDDTQKESAFMKVYCKFPFECTRNKAKCKLFFPKYWILE